MPTTRDERVRRARDLVAPHLAEPGTLGAFLYGSSARPWADPTSDMDVQVVVDDERLAAIDPRARHVAEHHGGIKAADIWIISPRELDAMIDVPTGDINRRRIATAAVLHDPSGIVARIIARAAEVRDDVRDERMRVHYFELTRLAKRIQVAERRDKQDIVRILTAELVLVASKLLFIERRQWPTPTMWIFDELALAGIPAALVAALEAIVESPTARDVRGVRGELDAYLVAAGAAFVRDPEALWSWLFESPRGREAMDIWGGECIRR